MHFLPILENFRFTNLDDVKQFIVENSDDAYQLAVSQLAITDLDILSESIGLQNLCLVYAIKHGSGLYGIKAIYDTTSTANRIPIPHWQRTFSTWHPNCRSCTTYKIQ